MRSPRVLLGWELGEQRGHVLRMRDVAVRLRREGVRIAWAAMRLDQLEGIAAPGEPVFQSPLWPGAHVEFALGRGVGLHLSHADLLADLGLAIPGGFHHLLRAWDAVLAAFRPDAVLADYAPALIAACRGRVPVVAAGIGFTLPPAGLSRFPRYPLPQLAAMERDDPEPPLLAEANAGLRRLARPPLPVLPELYAADVVLVSAFRELDPYAEYRQARPVPPSLIDWAPPSPAHRDGIVVYWSERLLNEAGFFEALAGLGVRARVVAPGLGREHVARYRHLAGLTFLARPLPFAEIAGARLVISNGSTGFVSAAMLAGLPQAVLPHDMQKELVGHALEGLGVGVSTPLGGVDWSAWRRAVRSLLEDGGRRDRALGLARRLIPRMHRDPAALAAEALLQLATATPATGPAPLSPDPRAAPAAALA